MIKESKQKGKKPTNSALAEYSRASEKLKHSLILKCRQLLGITNSWERQFKMANGHEPTMEEYPEHVSRARQNLKRTQKILMKEWNINN